jgi:hypothetical protein
MQGLGDIVAVRGTHRVVIVLSVALEYAERA